MPFFSWHICTEVFYLAREVCSWHVMIKDIPRVKSNRKFWNQYVIFYIHPISETLKQRNIWFVIEEPSSSCKPCRYHAIVVRMHKRTLILIPSPGRSSCLSGVLFSSDTEEHFFFDLMIFALMSKHFPVLSFRSWPSVHSSDIVVLRYQNILNRMLKNVVNSGRWQNRGTRQSGLDISIGHLLIQY